MSLTSNISASTWPNPQNEQISKLSLLLVFGQVEAEIFEVKDTRGHFQSSHFCVILSHFSE